MTDLFSYQMHDQTERPGQWFSQDVHNIIRHRYDFAATFAENKRVLEVGVGHAMAARLLSKKAANYVAGEFSDENIELIRNRKDIQIPLAQFDAHYLPFKPNSFDAIVTMAMIYYLDLEKFLDQAKILLANGGKFVFCTSNKEIPGFVAAPYTKTYFTIPELNKILVSKGFDTAFFGAFLAPGGTYRRRKTKAIIKNTLKTMITALPSGNKLWLSLRKNYTGQTSPLPWHVEEIKAESADCISLPNDQTNRDYRIIYGVATLRKPI